MKADRVIDGLYMVTDPLGDKQYKVTRVGKRWRCNCAFFRRVGKCAHTRLAAYLESGGSTYEFFDVEKEKEYHLDGQTWYQAMVKRESEGALPGVHRMALCWFKVLSPGYVVVVVNDVGVRHYHHLAKARFDELFQLWAPNGWVLPSNLGGALEQRYQTEMGGYSL